MVKVHLSSRTIRELREVVTPKRKPSVVLQSSGVKKAVRKVKKDAEAETKRHQLIIDKLTLELSNSKNENEVLRTQLDEANKRNNFLQKSWLSTKDSLTVAKQKLSSEKLTNNQKNALEVGSKKISINNSTVETARKSIVNGKSMNNMRTRTKLLIKQAGRWEEFQELEKRVKNTQTIVRVKKLFGV